MRSSDFSSQTWEFANFRLDPLQRTLERDGQLVPIKPKEFDVLAYLVSRHGQIVTKEEIFAAVWPDSIVEESNLSVHISSLRRALQDRPSEPMFIETIPRRGYRFLMTPASPSPATATPVATRRSAVSWRLSWLLGGVVVAGAALIWMLVRPTPEVSWNPVPFTSEPGLESSPALSPDGTQVLYEMLPAAEATGTAPGLFLKTIGAGAPTRVTSGFDMNPAWSPNGREFAFIHLVSEPVQNQRLQLVVRSSFGGEDRVLREDLEYSGPRPGPGISYTADGKWLLTSIGTGYFPGSPPRQLVAVSRDTGELRKLMEPVKGSAGDSNPIISPSGDRLAFCRCAATNTCDVYDVAFSNLAIQGELRKLTEFPSPEMRPAYLADGSLIYSLGPPDARALWRTSFDWRGRPVSRQVSPLGDDFVAPTVARTSDGKNRLVFTRSTLDLNIWRADLNGPDGSYARSQVVIASNRTDEMPAYSPDNRQIAFASTRSGMWEIWICRAADGQACRQLTQLGPAYTRHPAWSPDGKWIAFGSRAKGDEDIFVIPAEGGSPRQITAHQASNGEPVWSADGRWLYFASNRTGRYEIYRVAAPANPSSSTKAEAITSSGGSSPRLSPDGKTMFFRGPAFLYQRMNLADRTISTQPKILSLVPPVPVTADLGYTIARIGDGAVLARFHWQSGLVERLLPVRFRRPAGLARSSDGLHLLYAIADRTDTDLILVDDLRF